MDVIRRIFGRSFARARAVESGQGLASTGPGVSISRHSAPQRRRKPSGGRGGKCRNRAQEHHAPAQGPSICASRRNCTRAPRQQPPPPSLDSRLTAYIDIDSSSAPPTRPERKPAARWTDGLDRMTRSPRSGQILQIAAFGPSMAPPGPRWEVYSNGGVLGAQR